MNGSNLSIYANQTGNGLYNPQVNPAPDPILDPNIEPNSYPILQGTSANIHDSYKNKNKYKNVIWDYSMEKILSDMGDEAQIYAYLHLLAHRSYKFRNMTYQLPIILFSAISGSGNFISTNFDEHTETIIICIGFLSIAISIISSIAQLLKLSENSEGHRLSYLSWEKFFHDIKFQLRRKRKNREDIKEFLNQIIPAYKRLKEISPDIPKDILKAQKKKKKFRYLNKPFMLNGFHSITPFITREEYNEDMEDIFQNINEKKCATPRENVETMDYINSIVI